MSQVQNPKKDNSFLFESSNGIAQQLVLFNDDFNLFDFVTDSLVEVCGHDRLQAEQCTLIAHYRGKCEVKNGEYSLLKPMKDELIRRGLTTEIQSSY